MYYCPTQMKANCFWSSVCRNRETICQNYSCISGTVLEIKFGLPAVLVVVKFRVQLFCMNSCVFRISQTVVLDEYLPGLVALASCNSLITPPGMQYFVWEVVLPGVYVWTFGSIITALSHLPWRHYGILSVGSQPGLPFSVTFSAPEEIT